MNRIKKNKEGMEETSVPCLELLWSGDDVTQIAGYSAASLRPLLYTERGEREPKRFAKCGV